MIAKIAALIAEIGLFTWVLMRPCPSVLHHGFLFGNACEDRRFGLTFMLMVGIVVTVLFIARDMRDE